MNGGPLKSLEVFAHMHTRTCALSSSAMARLLGLTCCLHAGITRSCSIRREQLSSADDKYLILT